MQKHCIANTTFLFRGLCFLDKSFSGFYTQSAQWGIIVKENVSQLRQCICTLSFHRLPPFHQRQMNIKRAMK